MTGWKRAARVPASLRRWLTILHIALHRWYHTGVRRLLGRERLNLERLEDIEAAGSLLSLGAGLAAAAVVRTAEPPGPTAVAEKPSDLADSSREARTVLLSVMLAA